MKCLIPNILNLTTNSSEIIFKPLETNNFNDDAYVKNEKDALLVKTNIGSRRIKSYVILLM